MAPTGSGSRRCASGLGWERVEILRNRRRALVVVESPFDSFGPGTYEADELGFSNREMVPAEANQKEIYRDVDPLAGAVAQAERLDARGGGGGAAQGIGRPREEQVTPPAIAASRVSESACDVRGFVARVKTLRSSHTRETEHTCEIHTRECGCRVVVIVSDNHTLVCVFCLSCVISESFNCIHTIIRQPHCNCIRQPHESVKLCIRDRETDARESPHQELVVVSLSSSGLALNECDAGTARALVAKQAGGGVLKSETSGRSSLLALGALLRTGR